MMANAVWRDNEREKNVKIYREQQKKEDQNSASYNKDFIRYVIKRILYSNIHFRIYVFMKRTKTWMFVENNWLSRQKWVLSHLELKLILITYNVPDEPWIQISLKDDFYI